mgnify:CR=1 FL=1
MKVSVITARELGFSERRRWEELQRANGRLASPYFCWTFTAGAAAARPDVRIAVMEEHHSIVGFFPFQRRWGAGLPVGGRLSDHHGVIAGPDTSWDWHALLKSAGLAYWLFDHLPAWQRPPGTAVTQARSPGLDLSRGYDAWLQRRFGNTPTLQRLRGKARKLAREVGPLRLELDCRDRGVFDEVVRLKSEQSRATGQLDFFAWAWTRALVEHVRDTDHPGFGGRLTALYAGDTLVAAHFGMRSEKVWHWWFPVYSRAHHPYSPGLQLLLRVAEGAAAQGQVLLDLGMGDEPYKDTFSDCAAPLVAGCVSRPSLVTAARAVRKGAGRWLRTSPVAQPLRPLVQRLRQIGKSTAHAT